MSLSALSPRHLVPPLVAAAALLSAAGAAEPADRPSDPEIAALVENELLAGAADAADDVTVSVTDGVALLAGRVETLLERWHAVRAARSVAGVRAVVDLTNLDPSELEDETVRSGVIEALERGSAVAPEQLVVRVRAGRVSLAGIVDSHTEARRATEVAAGARGVRAVAADLVVDPPASRSAEAVADEVEARLDANPLLDAGLIEVDVRDGRVVLRGRVASRFDRTLAASEAWVAGVSSVDTRELAVEPWLVDPHRRRTTWPELTDAAIGSALRRALELDPRVPAERIEVEVKNGRVRLGGDPGDPGAATAAVDDAHQTLGVTAVEAEWDG
jgi:osmotically-inducible protein OsmY